MEYKFDLSKVKFSKNDIKSNIKIPKKLTADLAYLIGAHIGDGHLTIFKREDGWLYFNAFSGDYKEEMEFYRDVIYPLIQQIYNKKVRVEKSTKNTLQIRFKSKAISMFKKNVLGLPSGKKKGKISIPEIIMKSRFKKYCLQGIVDTDFSLSFRHGKYPRISCSLTLEDKLLKDQIIKIFNDIGISAVCSKLKRKDLRYSPPKEYEEYKIDVNGKKNLNKWLEAVGFRNPKHITKLEVWRISGFCKPFSTIKERKMLLPR